MESAGGWLDGVILDWWVARGGLHGRRRKRRRRRRRVQWRLCHSPTQRYVVPNSLLYIQPYFALFRPLISGVALLLRLCSESECYCSLYSRSYGGKGGCRTHSRAVKDRRLLHSTYTAGVVVVWGGDLRERGRGGGFVRVTTDWSSDQIKNKNKCTMRGPGLK